MATVDGLGSTWTNKGTLVVGNSGNGTLGVTNGGAVSSNGGSIGAASGSTSVATVDGAGSTWTSGSDLYVGNLGSGTLNITNGGAVSVAGTTYVGFAAGSTGAINFGPNGGTLTTGSLAASSSQLTGTGTINARGLVSDVNLVFNSAASLKQTLTFNNQPSQNITVNLDLASAPSTNGALGAGWQGNGSLTIEGGITVNSQVGYIGYGSGSTGVATVDGAGSTWTNNGSLYVGSAGAGTLNIAGGGAVAATGVSISNSQSLLAIDVGNGSRLTVAGGTITNNGAVRILAGALPMAGATFTPISAAAWSGSGTYQAIGGTWSASSHVFTVSAVVAGAAGTPVAINPSKEQRVLISGAGTSVGASFSATASTSTIGLTALPTSSTALSSLASRLGGGESVLSDWTFLSANYASGNPVYLSLSIAGGYSHNDFDVWDYNGVAWAALAANDFVFDGSFASFTAYALNGYSYAVTGVALLPGDANGDGKVDINDLTIVLANFGKSTGMSWSSGDFNNDGKVDVNDLTIVLANYGQTAGAAGMAAVPEPTTVTVLPASAVCLFAFAWRRRTVAKIVAVGSIGAVGKPSASWKGWWDDEKQGFDGWCVGGRADARGQRRPRRRVQHAGRADQPTVRHRGRSGQCLTRRHE